MLKTYYFSLSSTIRTFWITMGSFFTAAGAGFFEGVSVRGGGADLNHGKQMTQIKL